MLNQGNLPIRQRLPQLESLVLQLVVPHRSSDEARQYLDNPGHDDAITRHHYKPLYAICFNVFAWVDDDQCVWGLGICFNFFQPRNSSEAIDTAVKSVHIYVRLFGNHWKPSKTIRNQGNLPIRQRPSRLVASRTWTRWHDDTMTRQQQQQHNNNSNSNSNNNNNSNSNSNSNSSSSTTAPTVPRWQPWRSTSWWWCRKRRQERRSSCNHAQKCCRSRKCRATESLHMYVKLYGKPLVTVWKYLKPFEDKINQGPLPIPLPIRQQLLSLLEPR